MKLSKRKTSRNLFLLAALLLTPNFVLGATLNRIILQDPRDSSRKIFWSVLEDGSREWMDRTTPSTRCEWFVKPVSNSKLVLKNYHSDLTKISEEADLQRISNNPNQYPKLLSKEFLNSLNFSVSRFSASTFLFSVGWMGKEFFESKMLPLGLATESYFGLTAGWTVSMTLMVFSGASVLAAFKLSSEERGVLLETILQSISKVSSKLNLEVSKFSHRFYTPITGEISKSVLRFSDAKSPTDFILAIRELDETWLRSMKATFHPTVAQKISWEKVFRTFTHLPTLPQGQPKIIHDAYSFSLDLIRPVLSKPHYDYLCLELTLYLNARTLLISEWHQKFLLSHPVDKIELPHYITLIEGKGFIPEIFIETSDQNFVKNLEGSMKNFEKTLIESKLTNPLPASDMSN